MAAGAARHLEGSPGCRGISSPPVPRRRGPLPTARATAVPAGRCHRVTPSGPGTAQTIGPPRPLARPGKSSAPPGCGLLRRPGSRRFSRHRHTLLSLAGGRLWALRRMPSLRLASRVLRVHARGQHHETAGAGRRLVVPLWVPTSKPRLFGAASPMTIAASSPASSSRDATWQRRRRSRRRAKWRYPAPHPAGACLPCQLAVLGGGAGKRQVAAFGGLSLLLVRQSPDGPDDGDGDGGADHRPGDIHPPPGVVVADDVGARVRAGFIEAPLIGLANRPSSATVEPTAMAALWPMLRPPVAVLRMMDTRIAVSTVSITSDRQSPPGLLIG